MKGNIAVSKDMIMTDDEDLIYHSLKDEMNDYSKDRFDNGNNKGKGNDNDDDNYDDDDDDDDGNGNGNGNGNGDGDDNNIQEQEQTSMVQQGVLVQNLGSWMLDQSQTDSNITKTTTTIVKAE